MKKTIRIYPGGGVRKMHDDGDAQRYGAASRRRASHVEPVNQMLRWLFHFIRKRVKDESRAASFTRLWPCDWQARIIDGPVLGPFTDRSKAIEAEVEWLRKNWILEGVEKTRHACSKDPCLHQVQQEEAARKVPEP